MTAVALREGPVGEDVQRRLTQAFESFWPREVDARRTAQGDERLARQAIVSSGTVPLQHCEPNPFRGYRTHA